jgi:hypothetical protein
MAATIVYDLDRDVRTVDAMASRLTPYIYEDELYGQMPSNLAKLTVGGLLMRLHRLNAIRNLLTPEQQTMVSAAQNKLNEVRRDWAVAYEGKLKREFQARMTSFNQFINESMDNPKLFSENFAAEAEKRAIVQALADDAASMNFMVDDIRGAITTLDNKLHRYLESGDFIWDERLKPAYPKDKYWFLYVK